MYHRIVHTDICMRAFHWRFHQFLLAVRSKTEKRVLSSLQYEVPEGRTICRCAERKNGLVVSTKSLRKCIEPSNIACHDWLVLEYHRPCRSCLMVSHCDTSIVPQTPPSFTNYCGTTKTQYGSIFGETPHLLVVKFFLQVHLYVIL